MAGLEEALDALHGSDPADFVAERKRLARELRASGDREGAAQVAAARKPPVPVWALNHLARERPQEIASWLEAVDALRAAMSDPKGTGRDGVRTAMHAHREQTERLVEAVAGHARPGGKPLSGAMVERVRDLVAAAAADEDLSAALRQGRLTEPADPDEVVVGGAEKTTRRVPAERPRKGRTSKGPQAEAEQAEHEQAEEAARVKAEEAERERAEREAVERARSEREAALVEAATREAERLDQRAGELRDAAEAAGERLEQARQALARRKSEAAAARQAADEALREARDARRRRDRLGRRG